MFDFFKLPQKPYSTNTFKVPKGNVGGGVVAASGHASGTFQRPSTAASGTAKGSASGGVTMRSSKSIGGVQRPVSAVLIPSSALNIRQESVHPYSDGACLPVVRIRGGKMSRELNNEFYFFSGLS